MFRDFDRHRSFQERRNLSARISVSARVAPYSAIDPEEYFTISKHGVTHVLNKEADFVPLVEWERDYIMFQKLARVTYG